MDDDFYTIVLHKHWMGSMGWEVIQSEHETLREAHREAKALCHDKTNTFCHCDYIILYKGKECK